MTENGDSLLLDAARERVHVEAAGIEALVDQLDENFVSVVHLIQDLEGKVFVTGSGTSGIIARRMAQPIGSNGLSLLLALGPIIRVIGPSASSTAG